MSVYRPTYTDPKTGERNSSAYGGITSSFSGPPHSGVEQIDAQDDRHRGRKEAAPGAGAQLQ